MRDLVIQPAKEGKGRAFTATLISYVCADSLWESGQTSTDAYRPVWMMVAGTDNELKPFVANLRLGRKAEILQGGRKADRFEVLKSAGFHVAWQRTTVGTTATLFAPDLFRLDPGMVDPKGVDFCVLPERKVFSRISVDAHVKDHLKSLPFTIPEDKVEGIALTAPLFIAYLDRRTRCPLIPDQRFYAQVLAASLHEGLASWGCTDRYPSYNHTFGIHRSLRFVEYGTDSIGLAPGVAFRSSHSTLEQFLAEQVELYFERVKEFS